MRTIVASDPVAAMHALGKYVCPECKGPLHQQQSISTDGESTVTAVYCPKCQMSFQCIDGACDFVTTTERAGDDEHQHYTSLYGAGSPKHKGAYDRDEWCRRWNDAHWPECQMILDYLGDVNGKAILCLGNGASAKEFYFAHCGARLIHSDLSFAGVLGARQLYDHGRAAGRIEFHAIDAYKIPLADGSTDIVYGFEFVHHLPDVPTFLREVRRVLVPGGKCVFFDGAYSPIWQGAKRTLLWPLMRLSHLMCRRSPADLRATRAGGYKEEELARIGRECGLSECFTKRTSLFHYMCVHGVGCVFGWGLPHVCYKIPGWVGRFMDMALTGRVPVLERSRIELLWGFNRPLHDRTVDEEPDAEEAKAP